MLKIKNTLDLTIGMITLLAILQVSFYPSTMGTWYFLLGVAGYTINSVISGLVQ